MITRTTRRQTLTEFGRAYYDRCRVVLAEADAADALAADLTEPRGRLRVTMPVHFGRHCVAPVLLKLAERHPGLELDLSFNDRFSDLADDDYDLAIRTGEPEDRPGMVARRVARQAMIVCAAPSYLRRHGTPADLADLADPARHQAIVYRRSGRIRPWLFPRDGAPPAEVLPANRIRLDDLDAIADVAAMGLGLAWLPSWLVRERIRAGALVKVLSDLPDFPYDAYAMWLQAPHLPRKVRLAIDALADALPGMMA